MKEIFKCCDFKICDVPVPKGYPSSQTHVGVAVHNHKVYIITSPYPSVKYNIIVAYIRAAFRKLTFGFFPKNYGEEYENPLLYEGIGDDIDPVHFKPYIGNPIVRTPPYLFGYPSFNSDPDIYVENAKIYILNREVIRKKVLKDVSYESHIRVDMIMFSIINNEIKYEKVKIIYEGEDPMMSLSLTKLDNGEYGIFYLVTSSYNTGDNNCNLYLRLDNKIDGCYNERRNIKITSDGYTPWHLSVFVHKGTLYAIIACIRNGEKQRCYQMLGEFSQDLSELKIYQTPLIDIPSYRGAAYVSDDNQFVLYSTTVYYKLKGSKSIDGRDVFVVKKDFEMLLNKLKYAK